LLTYDDKFEAYSATENLSLQELLFSDADLKDGKIFSLIIRESSTTFATSTELCTA